MSDARNRAYLGMGSNIEPELNLLRAVRLLKRFGRVVAVSSVWESGPVGLLQQPTFLNAAVLLETDLSAKRLRLWAIDRIETELGRVRDPAEKNGPRTIDLDVALFNRETLHIEHRRIPDPDILVRPFLAVPLAEIDPNYVHPVTGETLFAIARQVVGQSTAALVKREDVCLLPELGPS